ncbi:ScyD/ScyE family protein [Cellulosimicrobium sp. Marseille-Q4280]|uniref:ScyD/ScyE family protein n=1 Tax=Cellulosimicrobium sp. Marseille-Q4280 TaxID=2937992 RepID=UPI00203F4DC4|nr:ScyD/ScyE family protein [Cellulosimicrobium sp. Marseille-Q4280]
MHTPRRLTVLVLSALLLATSASAAVATPPRPDPSHSAPTLLATGLSGGAGSTIGPDGSLYVTEPRSGEVSRVDRRTGEISTVVSGLPTQLPGTPGGAIDVAFLGRTAYVLVTIVEPAVVGLYRVDRSGGVTPVADIGAWSIANPPDTDFFVPSGVQYALESYRGGFLVTDGHHNRVLRVTTRGEVTEVLALGNVVPTGLETVGRTVLLAQAGPVPHLPEDGRVVAFRPGSQDVREVASGGRLLVDVESGHGHLFALAQGTFTPGSPEGSPAAPDTGQLLEVGRHGDLRAVAVGLDRPTSVEIVGRTAYVVTLDGEVWTVRLGHGHGHSHGH